MASTGLPGQPALAPVKVLHVITRFWAGAGGNTLLSATGMDPRRYQVWIAGCPGGDLWERAEAAGVSTVQLDGFREVLDPVADARVLVELVRLIRRERFTVVHTHSAKGGFLGRLAARICRVPVVVHTFHGFSVHDYQSPLRHTAYLLLERSVRGYADRYAAVAPRVAREAVEQRMAPPGSVTVVPSAVELDRIPWQRTPLLREQFGIPHDCPVVGMVGRVDLQKAPLDFVRAAALIAEWFPTATFVLLGDGPLLEDVCAAAAEHRLRLIAPGHVSNAAELAAGFDVFVIPSLYEGLGRAVTEALASGRPVVASAVNGVPDLVEHGVTGLLAPPEAPERVAECVRWLLDHPEEADRLGQQGQARVRAGFSPERMCGLLDELYSELLGLPATDDERSSVVPRPRTGALLADA